MACSLNEIVYVEGMNKPNIHAQAMGRMGKGVPKTMSPEAIRQRQEAAKTREQKRRVAKAKKPK